MKKIVKLAVGPGLLVKNGRQITPSRWETGQQRRSMRPSDGWIEIDQGSDPFRIFIGEAGNHGCAKRDSSQINGAGDVQNIEEFV